MNSVVGLAYIPVAEPPGAVDRVMITSSEIDPLITDTLTVTLPASSRTE